MEQVPTTGKIIKKNMKTDSKQSKFCPPLRDEFTKFGDKFEKIAHNEASGMYCYKRTTSEGLTYYEVFKAPTTKDENGNAYEYYPTSSQNCWRCSISVSIRRWRSPKRLQAMPRVRSKWRLRLRLSFPLLRRRTKF